MEDKTIPKYLQLKKEMMSWLLSGRFKPHDRMPSEHEIAGRYGLSRQTVRQTLGELEKEGWLYKQQGKGTFVSQPRGEQAGETMTVGMIATYISDYIFPHIVRGTEATLREKGCSLLLSSTDNDKAKERDCLELMLSRSVQGLVIEPTKSAQGNPNLSYYLALQARNIPFVMINERYPELDCPCLRVDDEAGGHKAAAHLIGLGHRRIAGFFKTDDLQGVYRMKGFLRALKEADIPVGPETVTHYATEEKWTKPYESALALLRKEEGERPTAFVCYNDELAVQLLEAARQTKLSVPEQLSVVGYDDSSLAVATEVKLTTLAHPKSELGVEAARMLIQLMESRNGSSAKDRVYEPVLVERESTRRIR